MIGKIISYYKIIEKPGEFGMRLIKDGATFIL